MVIFDKIKSSVSDASQKASNWASDTSQKTKDAVTKAVDKMSAKSQGETDQNLQDIEVSNVTMHDFQQTVSEEQVSPVDVAARNGKAKKSLMTLLKRSVQCWPVSIRTNYLLHYTNTKKRVARTFLFLLNLSNSFSLLLERLLPEAFGDFLSSCAIPLLQQFLSWQNLSLKSFLFRECLLLLPYSK